ncbi:MAG: alpha/beta hydrolase family protein [Gemmatimonadota bacterium]
MPRSATRRLTTRLAAMLAVLLPLAPRSTPAQTTAPRQAVILLLKGTDTLLVERVQRTATGATGVIVGNGMPRIALRFTIAPDQSIPAAEFDVFGPAAAADAAPMQSGAITFRGDSAHLEIRAGGVTRPLHLATRAGALPLMNNDFIAMEQMVRTVRARGVRSLTLPLFALAGAATLDGTIDLVGADSARLRIGPSAIEAAVDAGGNITGGRIPAQDVRIVVVTGTEAAAVPYGRPDYSAPAGAPYTAEEVTVKTPAGHTLAGTLTRPPSAGRVPAVVTITGSGMQDRDEYIPFAGGVRPFRQIADTLGRRGIAVLRLDDRGAGGSGGDVNGTSADFADDIRAAVAYLRGRADIDPARIALVGHSEGGMIAPMIAATDPRLAAIALMAGPAFSGREIIDYQTANLVRGDTTIPAGAKDSALRATRAQVDSSAAGSPWLRYFLTYDPLPTARRVRQPVLILQGATDQQVRPVEAEQLEATLRAAGNARVTRVTFPDRNHLFLRDPDGFPGRYARLTNPRIDGEVLGTLADWLSTTFTSVR